MMVGPGTTATLIIYAGHSQGLVGFASLAAIGGEILAPLFVALFFASQIGKMMSNTLRIITTRLMGMILLAIAVGMVVAGMAKVLPGLAPAVS